MGPMPERKSGNTVCSCAALRRVARRATQVYDHALRPAGIRVTQYSLLSNLAEAGGLSVTELAERLEMDRTTLTRNLRPLQAAGWARLAPGPDRRSRAVEITGEGRRILEAARPLWQEAERAFRRTLGREQAAELRRLLDSALEILPR